MDKKLIIAIALFVFSITIVFLIWWFYDDLFSTSVTQEVSPTGTITTITTTTFKPLGPREDPRPLPDGPGPEPPMPDEPVPGPEPPRPPNPKPPKPPKPPQPPKPPKPPRPEPEPVPQPFPPSSGDMKITLGGNVKQVMVKDAIYPDGVSVVLPKGYKNAIPANKYWTCLPEAYNRAGFTDTPFFEELNIENDLPIVHSLGSHERPFEFPNNLNAGTFWIFGVHKTPTQWAAFLHGESHGLGEAGETWKSQLISYSKDLIAWSRPRQIIVCPPFDGRKTWYGAGDSSFVFDEEKKEYRGYFFEAQRGMGVARSVDPEAAPGTWQLYNGPGRWVDALTATEYSRLPINGGNPQVIYSRLRKMWVMLCGEWGQAQLTFALSADGYNWGNITRVAFDASPVKTPLYVHIVSAEGGTIFFDRKARLYWSSTENARKMMSRDITID